MRYKDTREIVSFIMTIVGDKDHLEQKNFELWDNDYTEKDNNFSGLVLYHELDGSFANGWRYTNGELTHKVTLDMDMDIDIGLKSYDCTTYDFYEITETCTEWYVNGEADGTSCETSYTYLGSQTNCVWVDDGGSGGGGGGNYEPSTICNFASSRGIDCAELVAFEQDYRNRMSESEKVIFDSMTRHQQLSYLANAQFATSRAEYYFPNSRHNGKGDAFRHACWNALNVNNLGLELTVKLTTSHESKPATYLYSYKEVMMDLYNNNVGRGLADFASLGFSSLTQCILNAVNNGSLKYLNNLDSNDWATSNSVLIPTNQ